MIKQLSLLPLSARVFDMRVDLFSGVAQDSYCRRSFFPSRICVEKLFFFLWADIVDGSSPGLLKAQRK